MKLNIFLLISTLFIISIINLNNNNGGGVLADSIHMPAVQCKVQHQETCSGLCKGAYCSFGVCMCKK
ncbi:hypothetical protein Mgra_00003886 [Meloidogyne graminicola]|uniref:Uncharacterized protein n=1 Tax=Meloidogyne graminicola TaxID=189291 RepID=A0A8S9ZU36_9BILA|nr:hypothetical protein Mgra_00003886 [Meloidogyne graminicola]